MSYTVLARKYRPQRFSEVIGQEHVTRTLGNAIAQQRIAHGYIFSGHRGIGKTTIARILAMALNCRSAEKPVAEPCGKCESCTEIRESRAVDVIEIDAATNRGIDEIRELREAARYRPARDRYKIFILDEAHQITDAAFNALLKTLEEPPGHIVFMMATTQPEDIPQTIRSRCQHFSFHAVKFDDIVGQLKAITKAEKIKVEDEALAVLAEAGDGSMRDALSILDQAIACSGSGEALGAELVRGLVGTISSEVLETLMDQVRRSASEEALRLIDKLVSEGQSPAHFARQLVRFLRNTLVARVAGEASPLLQISSDERARVGRVAQGFSEEELTRFLNIALRTHEELGYRQEQRFHLEMGVMKMLHASRLLPIEELLSSQPLPARGAASPSPAKAAPPMAAPAASRMATSPFDADRARKSRGPEMSSGAGPAAETAPRASSTTQATVAVLAAAAAMAESITDPEPHEPMLTASLDDIRAAVAAAFHDAGQSMLGGMLEAGEWSLTEGKHEVQVKVARSQTMVDASFGSEQKRLAQAAATKAAGRLMKIVVSGGGTERAAVPHRGTARPASSAGARARAAADPLVQHFQEKFNAEIRTVMDQKKDGGE